ncbi:MAG: HlyC/CorC family transporter [Lachnospiraceae bacterium]|nr:HlyC/CorC family transporter [Lachnospiraceae bacterium]
MITTIISVAAGIVLCIAASAFFSGSEMALSACNTVRLENEEKSGNRKAGRALKLSTNFDDTLSAILVGNNLVNIAASSLTTVLIILLTGGDKLNWLGTLVVTILVIIFGETIPKIACKKNANRVSMSVSGLIQFLIYVFKPLNFLVVGLVNLLTKGIRAEEDNDQEESAMELQSIIETAEDEGVLDSDRSELLTAAIDFSDISAEEVMTARVDMEALNIDDDPEEILETVLQSTHSRMPVYEDSIDNIIGVIHLNHLLKSLASEKKTDIRSLMMPACFVYRTMRLPQCLDTMKKARQHLAIVTDEYSGTLGVISMEDILEEIVGDIWDETDTVEEKVVRTGENDFTVDGDMNIADFCELLGIPEESFDYESNTAGGFMIEYLGEFPKVGDAVEYAGFRIEVTEMDERRVEKLHVMKLAETDESADE